MTLDARSVQEVPALLAELESTRDPRRIEVLADVLGNARDPAAIPSLLGRLGDTRVQEDRDVEDAVCRALVARSVMRALGNLRFAFVPQHELPMGASDTMRALGPSIPMRYFISSRVSGLEGP